MTERNLDPRSTSEPFKAGFETYLSPFTYRYGTPEMRKIWSLNRFWGGVRDVWIATTETQQEVGLATQEQVEDKLPRPYGRGFKYGWLKTRTMFFLKKSLKY